MQTQNLLLPHVLASSSSWLVLSKPAGWLTIPGRASPTRLLEAASPGDIEVGPDQVLSDWARSNFGAIWVVHRLDRETSGVVLFARNEQGHALASSWFQSRQVKKTYHCLAQGKTEVPFFKTTHAIQGAPSSTQVEVKESFENCFLARVFPRTGRRHQIRIHLAQTGYPILGDSQYGGVREISVGIKTLSIPRVALHASSLELPTQEKFEASFPADFSNWLSVLREGASRA